MAWTHQQYIKETLGLRDKIKKIVKNGKNLKFASDGIVKDIADRVYEGIGIDIIKGLMIEKNKALIVCSHCGKLTKYTGKRLA